MFDQKTLLAIVITAVITTIVREGLIFAARHTAIGARALFAIATKWMRGKSWILRIAVDLFLVAFPLVGIIIALRSKEPATEGFVAQLVILAILHAQAFVRYNENAAEFMKMRRERKAAEPGNTDNPDGAL